MDNHHNSTAEGAATVQKPLLARAYQEEIFSQALHRNIIAALPTGAGKTYIATLLMKWIASQSTSKGKPTVFLAPKVVLVEQQGEYIAKTTSLRVVSLHGQMNLSLMDRSMWTTRFESFDVLVLTAQLFLDLLTHSLWSLSKISCLIIDECHHTRKNHPYAGVMREYFHMCAERRPKIFAMTASPIWNPKDPAGSLKLLEACLNAQVVGVCENADELSSHSKEPTEYLRHYSGPPAEYEYPSPLLQTCISVFDMPAEIGDTWATIHGKYQEIFDALGPYCAELYLHTEVRRALNVQPSHAATHDRNIPCSNRRHIEDILADFDSCFVSLDVTCQLTLMPDPVTVTLDWCSPKLRALIEVIQNHQHPKSQGIVFVKTRAVAACLATILPLILKQGIRCSLLMGTSPDSGSIAMAAGNQNTLEQFRSGATNLLIATSVAEEGLDFPACDVVIRFDPLEHIVGYLQSRGRARSKASTFVVMIQEDDVARIQQYESFVQSEPIVKSIYQSRANPHTVGDHIGDDTGSEDEEEIQTLDMASRERFVVATTGAVLTYDNSIGLLSYICSLIPCDTFTTPPRVQYSGDKQVDLQLPSALPIPDYERFHVGPHKRTKKEAKRAAAFLCVKRLHAIGVFDDYLLPVLGAHDEDESVGGGRSSVPVLMDIFVCDPWVIGDGLWIHPILVDGISRAGLITGTLLPTPHWQIRCARAEAVGICPGQSLGNIEEKDLKVMIEFTKLAIYYTNTATPLRDVPSMFAVPVVTHGPHIMPDMPTMQRLVDNPLGSYDWSDVTQNDLGRLLIVDANSSGNVLLLSKFRRDLTPSSAILPGSPEVMAGFATYSEYFHHRYTGRTLKTPYRHIPTDSPLVEAIILSRINSDLFTASNDHSQSKSQSRGCSTPKDCRIVPQECCRWVALPEDLRLTYSVLPPLCRYITGLYRTKQARLELGLPLIHDELLIEALTLPCAGRSYSNQRLETLGDAVLEVCTSVHLFNRYPYYHEGQLTTSRQNFISNKSLLHRARKIGLEYFLIGEPNSSSGSSKIWKYTCNSHHTNDGVSSMSLRRYVKRQFPRRSLQDCMEAILGAAFLSGGIPTALQAGTALTLAFGGPIPWCLRYSRSPEFVAIPPTGMFDELQEDLGYRFRDSALLIEALTHPTFAASAGGRSYQRLEFLGDAVLDLVVIKYMYDRFPHATSDQLAWPRTRAICAPALAFVAVKQLGLHRLMFVNNMELSACIEEQVPILSALSSADIVKESWKYSPPKALSDVYESLVGAILVDSGYNYEKTSGVVEFVMNDILTALSPFLPRDPITQVISWLASKGCRQLSFEKIPDSTGAVVEVALLVHTSRIASANVAWKSVDVAKALASEEAIRILREPTGVNCLSSVCVCNPS